MNIDALKHRGMLLIAFLAAVVVVSVSAYPGRTASKTVTSWDRTDTDQPMQSANVHALVGASFHAVHAGF
jgi:hypothetical protein